jgi:hypothetical protein
LDKSTKKTLLVVLVPASATVLIGFFQYVLPFFSRTATREDTRTFTGTVADEQTGKLIHGAKVSLEVKGLSPVTYTDSEGRFSFIIASDLDQIKIRVDANGYKSFERRISPSGKVEPEDIRLTLTDPSPKPITPVKPPRVVKPNRELTQEEKRRRALEDLNSKGSSPSPN